MEPWRLEKVSKCFNCGKEVSQIIEIFPNQAYITCSNCGAKRYYIIRRIGIENEDIIIKEKNKKHKYDIWSLSKIAVCFNCKKEYVQEILITETKLIVRCKNCGFTRVYQFHILEIK